MYRIDGEEDVQSAMKCYQEIRRDREGWHQAMEHSSNMKRTIKIKCGNAFGFPKWSEIKREKSISYVLHACPVNRKGNFSMKK